MTPALDRPFLTRLVAKARTELAVLSALFVAATGVLVFVEVADDMTEADGQAFDHHVLALMRPYADDPGRPWGPWWRYHPMISNISGRSRPQSYC